MSTTQKPALLPPLAHELLQYQILHTPYGSVKINFSILRFLDPVTLKHAQLWLLPTPLARPWLHLKEPSPKGNSTVSAYLQSIRNIADELALIGHPIDDLEMVIHALNGLGLAFREFTTFIRTRDSPILFNELYEKLVDFEMCQQREERLSTNTPVTANHVQRRHHANGCGRPSYQPNTENPSFNHKKPLHDGPVICQFCEKPGH